MRTVQTGAPTAGSPLRRARFFMTLGALWGTLAWADGAGLHAAEPSPFLPSPIRHDAHLFRTDQYGRIQVLGHIDGQGPFEFLLDTGAGRTTINRGAVYRLDLEPLPRRTARVRTATGIMVAQIFRVGGITALGHRISLGRVPALSDPVADQRLGILGVDLLRGKVLHVSHSGQGIRLLDEAGPFIAAGWSTFEGRPVGRGSLALDVRIGDVRLPAIVDTGASHSVVNLAAMRQLLDATAFHEARDTTRVVTASGDHAGVVLEVDEAKYINDTRWRVSRLIAADLPIFTLLGAKSVPAMVLGMDLLGDKDMAVDLRGWRLFLRTDPDGQSVPELD